MRLQDPYENIDDFFNSYFYKKDELYDNKQNLIMITSTDAKDNDLLAKQLNDIKQITSNQKVLSSKKVKEYVIEKYDLNKYNINCSKPQEDNNINIKCDKIYDVIYILNKFIEFKLLIKKGTKFYLNDGENLKWKNIIKSKDILYKINLWYFRKIMVDSIIYDIVGYYKQKNDFCKNLQYVSVGSNNITSDYDVTLSGTNNKCTSMIIFKYYKIMSNIFNDISEEIFDTNLYGGDFINHDVLDKLSVIPLDNSNCNLQDINKSISPIFTNFISNKNTITEDIYIDPKLITSLPSSKSQIYTSQEFNFDNQEDIITGPCDKIDQRIWSYIKFLTNYKNQLKENYMYRTSRVSRTSRPSRTGIGRTMAIQTGRITIDPKQSNSILWKRAQTFILANNRSNMDNDIYGRLIYQSSNIIKKYNMNNYLSLVNYFGNETYYTRGAFIDVVVNQQMLKDTNIIPLDEDDYINSFIENISDYVYHGFKEKYLKRCIKISNRLNHKLDSLIMEIKVIDDPKEAYDLIYEYINEFAINL